VTFVPKYDSNHSTGRRQNDLFVDRSRKSACQSFVESFMFKGDAVLRWAKQLNSMARVF
jgi:hypothetical protein